MDSQLTCSNPDALMDQDDLPNALGKSPYYWLRSFQCHSWFVKYCSKPLSSCLGRISSEVAQNVYFFASFIVTAVLYSWLCSSLLCDISSTKNLQGSQKSWKYDVIASITSILIWIPEHDKSHRCMLGNCLSWYSSQIVTLKGVD